jgi:hypothetical protein
MSSEDKLKSLRNKLKQQAAQNSPKLSDKERKRLSKLEGILEQLKREKNVQNRKLQLWLTEDEYAEFENEWQSQIELREELKDKPDEIKEYEEILKKALFEYNKAEGYSTRGHRESARKFHASAQKHFEGVLERLQEIIHANPNLQVWFDRRLDFNAESHLSIDPISIPRVITSRSLDNLSKDSRIFTKKEVKTNIVERAIDRLKRGY